MEGRGLGVDQGWVCCGVFAGSLTRDYLSLLYEEGSACYGCHRCLHQGFEEGGGKLRRTSRVPPFWCYWP